MIEYDAAVDLIRSSVRTHGRRSHVGLAEASGRTLAADFRATTSHPRFDNSAVDGYCVGCQPDGRSGSRLALASIVFAGEEPGSISPGTAVRVMTGAALPTNAFGVAMQEDVSVEGREIVLQCEVHVGDFVRREAADIGIGETVLSAGTRLSPGAIAVLASQGAETLEVFDRVRIGLLTTGDEIVEVTAVPGPSQLRNSNLAMLKAQVGRRGGEVVFESHCPDRPDELDRRLRAIAGAADLAIVVGGASVGDRDYVASTVARLGAVAFHNVKIRPGKPTLFGSIEGSAVLGLPGNPASAFVCFELFGVEAIDALEGKPSAPRWFYAPFGADHAGIGRDDFVRVKFDGHATTPVHEQASYGLKSLAAAEALVRLRASLDHRAGELRPTLML